METMTIVELSMLMMALDPDKLGVSGKGRDAASMLTENFTIADLPMT